MQGKIVGQILYPMRAVPLPSRGKMHWRSVSGKKGKKGKKKSESLFSLARPAMVGRSTFFFPIYFSRKKCPNCPKEDEHCYPVCRMRTAPDVV